MAASDSYAARPRALLTPLAAVAVIVGVVVGIGIFKTPALVAQRIDDPDLILALWGLGALIMLAGALCYGELAAVWPDAGGEVHFLDRAYGPLPAFLFAWGRLAVVQTGAIALVAFVFGDYAQRLFALGPYGPSVYGAAAVAAVTAANMRGTVISAHGQTLIAGLLVAAVALAALAGFVVEAAPAPALVPPPAGSGGMAAALGTAMIFIMLTYGGWNEAAYLSAELRAGPRTMVRVLVAACAVIAVLYLALNAAYLEVLGRQALASSAVPGADYMAALAGGWGEGLLSAVVMLAALSTLNATVFTGARSAYALGRDLPALAPLGRWDARAEGPVAALAVQGGLALALIGFGTVTRDGFTAMVDYTAPVFWFFLMLTGGALFAARRRGEGTSAGFRVPFYPLTPALFCLAAAAMLYSALAFTRIGAVLGIAVLALGLPVWFWGRRRVAV